ncbi:MAG: hypothetical protein J6T44_00085 [Prevotella sp.]|nr:hypothetical protein [Prevotella sp.]
MKIIYLIICVLLLMACGDRPKQQPSNTENDRVEELYDRAKADSVCQEILRKAKDEVELEKKSSPKSVTKKTRSQSSSSRGHKSKKPKYDNMRGFDPASEDDMDDNGMSRYMENNDEEGWD